ncbi:MAG: hypothetical protein AAFY41_02935 [Bacteroidota bacterium]
MKKLIYLFIATLISFSCTETDLADEGFEFEFLPGYVAFNAPGSSINLDTLDFMEGESAQDDDPGTADGGVTAVSIENPTGTLSDITVGFELSGDAVFGTDYIINNAESATAGGGSIILDNDVTDVNQFNFVNFEIDFPTDAVTDGEKILVITLTSAVNEDGETFAVGRGGTETLRSAIIRISDID